MTMKPSPVMPVEAFCVWNAGGGPRVWWAVGPYGKSVRAGEWTTKGRGSCGPRRRERWPELPHFRRWPTPAGVSQGEIDAAGDRVLDYLTQIDAP
jgi:hypothetical protein